MNFLFDPSMMDDIVPDIPLKVRALLIIAGVFLLGALISLPFALIFGGLGLAFLLLFITTAACYLAGAGTLALTREGD